MCLCWLSGFYLLKTSNSYHSDEQVSFRSKTLEKPKNDQDIMVVFLRPGFHITSMKVMVKRKISFLLFFFSCFCLLQGLFEAVNAFSGLHQKVKNIPTIFLYRFHSSLEKHQLPQIFYQIKIKKLILPKMLYFWSSECQNS